MPINKVKHLDKNRKIAPSCDSHFYIVCSRIHALYSMNSVMGQTIIVFTKYNLTFNVMQLTKEGEFYI